MTTSPLRPHAREGVSHVPSRRKTHVVDLFGISEGDDSEDILDYYILLGEDRKVMFHHYNEYPAKVPSVVLHFQSVVKRMR